MKLKKSAGLEPCLTNIFSPNPCFLQMNEQAQRGELA